MSNPTVQEIFAVVDQSKVDTILANLDLDGCTDARLAVQKILEKLHTAYQAIPQGNRPSTYTIARTTRNIDIDTQRQTFAFTFDMALTTNGVENEPVTP